jgi:hypothetical protein
MHVGKPANAGTKILEFAHWIGKVDATLFAEAFLQNFSAFLNFFFLKKGKLGASAFAEACKKDALELCEAPGLCVWGIFLYDEFF